MAVRHEDDALPTVLVYGHGDVVLGEPERWRTGLDPWQVVVEGDRWYGRGTADNKGQHTINFAALEQVLRVRGRSASTSRCWSRPGRSPARRACARSAPSCGTSSPPTC
ncbi:M20/M25/M40 family metallo-hydrolase [Streptomyces indonesiensis]